MNSETSHHDRLESYHRRRLLKMIGAAFLTGGTLISQYGCGRSNNTSQPTNARPENAAPPAQSDGMPSGAFMSSRAQMKNLLKKRISWDDQETFSKSGDNWNTVKLGIYYDWDDELVNIVIYETTALAAGLDDRYLPDDVWRNLVDKVGPEKTPEEALDPMVDASLLARKVTQGEPPSVNRPRSRPTLKSARNKPPQK